MGKIKKKSEKIFTPKGILKEVNYSATSYRASCFTHYCIGRDVTQLNVLRNVHRRISLGYSIPTVYVLFMLLH